MCGITGIISLGDYALSDQKAIAIRMAMAIQHRGPDDAGAWADEKNGIALGHRRLSIVDLSPAGHQPMDSRSGRYIIAFNGEIYNHQALRDELQAVDMAPEWRGHSDTETLLAAFEYWGVDATLKRTVGMFAIALWDRQENTLHLMRDRFGEKPLYYGWVGQDKQRAFVFGSELKSLKAFPGFDNPICRDALGQYLRFVYVPAPYSIYEGIYKLEPGCLLSTQGTPPAIAPVQPLRPGARHENLTLTRWWSLAEMVEASSKNLFSSESEGLNALEAQLTEAVKLQLLADVPLGAFLSGGVDSSAIVALMQQQNSQPVRTFTVGFEESAFDESPYARAVAQHLGTLHTDFVVSAEEVRSVIRLLPTMYDEPFADSSQIPTHLVCRAARQHVTVALSGDAGDELFGGYNRYFWGPRIWSRLSWLPKPFRTALATAITGASVGTWDSLGELVNTLRPGTQGIQRVGEKAHKLATRLKDVNSIDALYKSLVSEWQDPASLVLCKKNGVLAKFSGLLDDPVPSYGVDDAPLRMMYRDSMTYLPDDILCKVDRAAMAVSLETRVPFLDHRVVELAWRMPLSMKIRGNQGKWALRQILYKHVPRELIERPKVGFGIPVGDWLRGPLREWAECLLDESRLKAEGYFDPMPIRQRWEQHLGGHHDYTPSLWAVLMFQAWLEENS